MGQRGSPEATARPRPPLAAASFPPPPASFPPPARPRARPLLAPGRRPPQAGRARAGVSGVLFLEWFEGLFVALDWSGKAGALFWARLRARGRRG